MREFETTAADGHRIVAFWYKVSGLLIVLAEA